MKITKKEFKELIKEAILETSDTQKKYYVYMEDTFMSGWGKAKDKTNIYLIVCDNKEQATIIAHNAKKRSEMKNITISEKYPKFDSNYLVSEKHYNELGKIWKEPIK